MGIEKVFKFTNIYFYLEMNNGFSHYINIFCIKIAAENDRNRN